MKVLLVSLLVATLASTGFANVVPQNEQNLQNTTNVSSTAFDLSEALGELLTAFKKVMPCGNATFGLPPLAPLRKPFVKVNFTGHHLSLKGEIKNVVVSGLDDFIFVQLMTNASINRTEMDMIYKDIQIMGQFNLAIEADVAGFKYIQPLKGLINIQFLNVRVTNGLTISHNEAGGIQLSNVEHSLHVGDIVVNNLNTEWSVAVNNFANQYIRDFSMLFLQTHRESYGKMYAEMMTQMGNKAFYNIPYNSISSAIPDFIKVLKSMECKQ